MNVEQKIRALKKYIEQKAEEEAERILGEARQSAKQIRTDYQRRAESRFSEIVSGARAEADRTVQRILAQASTEARSRIIEARSDLLEAGIDGLRAKAQALASSKAYPRILTSLIVEALEALDEKRAILSCRKADRALVEAAVKELPSSLGKMKISISGEHPEMLGGIIAESEDHKLIVKNTFAEKIEEYRERLYLAFSEGLDESLR